MQEIESFLCFTKRFDEAGIEYMITGSVASMLYGEPRLTNDIDVVVVLKPGAVEKIPEAFPSEDFYSPPLETLHVEARRDVRGHFNLIHHATGCRADVYLAGTDPFHVWAMKRRKQVSFSSTELWLAPPEYVIIRKLEYYKQGGSQKHMNDIKSMLQMVSDDLDMKAINRFIVLHGVEQEWRSLHADL